MITRNDSERVSIFTANPFKNVVQVQNKFDRAVGPTYEAQGMDMICKTMDLIWRLQNLASIQSSIDRLDSTPIRPFGDAANQRSFRIPKNQCWDRETHSKWNSLKTN